MVEADPFRGGVLDFGREVCADFAIAGKREWLVTNGLGGYASGTVAGQLSRRYHCLLVAALQPPLGRRLLLAKLDETARYAGQVYPLYHDQWANGEEGPGGYRHLEHFHLEGTTPVWSYALADALLEKRVWMQPGANTTYLIYDLRRGSHPVELTIRALANDRNHHDLTQSRDRRMLVEALPHGLRVQAEVNGHALYLLSDRADAQPDQRWQADYFLSLEAYRGLAAVEDHFSPGAFHARLRPGEALTLVASTTPDPSLDGRSAYEQRQAHERDLIQQAGKVQAQAWLQQLVLAAGQFIVQRDQPGEPDGRTIIAGYPWFADWGRDTMISLPGLALTTGRKQVAKRILRTYASCIDQGMLPNHFPESGQAPEYNTADASLWYIEAVRAYHQKTGDDELLRELFPALQEIAAWHQRGTRYSIQVDPQDGLLYAGQAGMQLTWMDVKIGDWVVTARTGKPVEVNALWYNAMVSMADFAWRLGLPARDYQAAAEKARSGFQRFWNGPAGYLYDVIDGPQGDDGTLRPNQLLAVSLPASPLEPGQQKAVVDVCALHLLTSHGLRSLAPAGVDGQPHPAYRGVYGGSPENRDAAYHQGTVWGWLIGPFVCAHLRVYRDPHLAQTYLAPLVRQLASHGVGTLSEIFDGEAPFQPRGCIAQAWTVAEVLRAWEEIEKQKGAQETR